MHRTFRNVNTAFAGLVREIHDGSIPTRRSSSRVGDVLQVDEPMTITYTHPLECVLFNSARDANPFFHVVEAIWMLAGRNDVAPLAYYNSQIADVASDDGKVFNGAYGWRWRHANGNWESYDTGIGEGGEWQTTDQLKVIIDQLKRKPESRRCVLQMWNVSDDLLKIDTTRDVCCNTHTYFGLRPDPGTGPMFDVEGKPTHIYYLDMTVCNRSNDMIWGMLGANVVHFAFLQEYMAACIGVEVGVYNQITNNMHVYVDRWEPGKWLADNTWDCYKGSEVDGPYHHVPLVKDPATFDEECQQFIALGQEALLHNWAEPFLQTVAAPMCWAFSRHKEHRDYTSALNTMKLVAADDWRAAGTQWLLKRKRMWKAKQGSTSSV